MNNIFLEPRTLGISDYPTDFPLKEVLVLGSHCAGGIILGFNQYTSYQCSLTSEMNNCETIKQQRKVPTPWHHLEAGIMFGLGLPLLVFKEEGITGGIFDNGVADVYVHQLPNPDEISNNSKLKEVIIKWQSKVREKYYK